MSFQDNVRNFQNKVRRMSPMQRMFTSAALAIPVKAAQYGLYMTMGAGVGQLGGLALSLAAILFVQSYADHSKGTYNVFGMGLSKDGMHNFGAYLASSMFVAPTVVGLAFGAVAGVFAENEHGNDFQPETEVAAIVEQTEASDPYATQTYDAPQFAL